MTKKKKDYLNDCAGIQSIKVNVQKKKTIKKPRVLKDGTRVEPGYIPEECFEKDN